MQFYVLLDVLSRGLEASPGAFTTLKSFMRAEVLKAEANRKMRAYTEMTARTKKTSKNTESEQGRRK
jgi:hypothetical protein